MPIKFKDFDVFKKREKRVVKADIHTLKTQEKIPLKELFPDRFIKDNTKYRTFYDFLVASKFDWLHPDDIDEADLDKFVKKRTNFNSWALMKKKATGEYNARKLGF